MPTTELQVLPRHAATILFLIYKNLTDKTSEKPTTITFAARDIYYRSWKKDEDIKKMFGYLQANQYPLIATTPSEEKWCISITNPKKLVEKTKEMLSNISKAPDYAPYIGDAEAAEAINFYPYQKQFDMMYEMLGAEREKNGRDTFKIYEKDLSEYKKFLFPEMVLIFADRKIISIGRGDASVKSAIINKKVGEEYFLSIPICYSNIISYGPFSLDIDTGSFVFNGVSHSQKGLMWGGKMTQAGIMLTTLIRAQGGMVSNEDIEKELLAARYGQESAVEVKHVAKKLRSIFGSYRISPWLVDSARTGFYRLTLPTTTRR